MYAQGADRLKMKSFAWINNFRRASKDFEILTLTAENVGRLAMIRVMLAKCF